jgi:hypothetical protein
MLKDFQPSSENRRILRKTSKFTFSLHPLTQFHYTPEVQKFCSDFVKSTFGKDAMPTAAIRKIFSPQDSNYTHVFTFHLINKSQSPKLTRHSERGNDLAKNPLRKQHQPSISPVGYVAAAISPSHLHYAHPFYDLKYQSDNLGIGMMTQAIVWSQAQHKAFVYLGTCYTPEALYKTQFSGFEFFTGYSWSGDIKILKTLIREQKEDKYLFQDKALLKKLGITNPEDLLKTHGIPAKLN